MSKSKKCFHFLITGKKCLHIGCVNKCGKSATEKGPNKTNVENKKNTFVVNTLIVEK
jgi:hypothetical protein